jgi:hypothetical protein
MGIRKDVTVFMNGSLQKVDLDSNGHVVKRNAAPVEKPVAQDAAKDKHMTKQELMAALKEKGIPFKATLNNTNLKALLDAGPVVEGDQEPAAELVPGTGNQDVI